MSHTNVISVNSTELNNSGPIRVGSNLTSGTTGQVLTSQGRDKSPIWGTNSAALPNALTAGNHITFSSGNPSFDGSIADTINATPGGGLIGSNGIDISGATISTDNDGTTINNTGGTGTQNQVLKVPNDLTISQNGTIIDTFNGSTAKTINLEGKYSAGDGIEISGHTIPVIEADTDEITISHNVGGAEKLQVLKVPNTLTAGTNIIFSSGTTYDGSSAITISSIDTDNQLNLIEDNGIQITNTGGLNRTIGAKVDGTTVDFDGDKLSVKKVPNALTAGTNISFSSGTTYDGSSAITINASDTDTTYQGGTGISIDTTTNPDTINCQNIPNSALANSTISGKSLGTSLANLTFYSNSGAFITSYNGADPPTSVVLDGDTTYQGGKNITVDTTTNPDTIDLDDDLDNIHSINFVGAAAAYGTELVGNNYPVFGYQTPMSYFNLTSTTNMIPGAVLATKVQRTTLIKSFSTTYGEYSSNFRTSFVAQSANVMVEFRAIVRADNKLFYGGLYDYNSSSWNTDQRNRFNYNDESDQDFTVNTWWMRNLTPGTTYYISPYFKSNSGFVYMYTGHGGTVNGYAPAVMRIIDGGNNVNVY